MYVSNDYGYKATQKQKHRISKHNGLEYPCDDCNYKATKTSHLKQHKEALHEGVIYKCNECGYKATQKSNLK